jgi:hypothetical protein
MRGFVKAFETRHAKALVAPPTQSICMYRGGGDVMKLSAMAVQIPAGSISKGQ